MQVASKFDPAKHRRATPPSSTVKGSIGPRCTRKSSAASSAESPGAFIGGGIGGAIGDEISNWF
jgi:hypothetical protein